MKGISRSISSPLSAVSILRPRAVLFGPKAGNRRDRMTQTSARPDPRCEGSLSKHVHLSLGKSGRPANHPTRRLTALIPNGGSRADGGHSGSLAWVPQDDPNRSFTRRSFDDLVGAGEQRLRHSEAERLGGLEV